MKINLLEEFAYKDKLEINDSYSFNEDYIKTTDIEKLDDVKVTGNILKNYDGDIEVNLNVVGTMYLTDAITLEIVPYDFSIEIEEILENSLKTLDLIEFLWHYIVLEIPIRYTISDAMELKKNYSDIYEEDENRDVNNPFKDFFKE